MNILIIFAAKYLFFISIVIAVWFFFTLNSTLKKKFITFTFASFALSFVTAKLLGSIFNNPRPFVSDHVSPLIAHINDNGFPSDHTLLTMTIASIVFFYNKKLGIILGVVSLIVGSSRVLAGVHHPIDVIGALGIAIVCVVSVRGVIKKIVQI